MEQAHWHRYQVLTKTEAGAQWLILMPHYRMASANWLGGVLNARNLHRQFDLLASSVASSD